jgi:hypothetical protein
MSEGNGTSDYVLGTANGIFAVDNPNGRILGLKKAATKDFDPTFAGTYKAIYYQKTGGANWPGKCSDGYCRLGQRDHGHQHRCSDHGHGHQRRDARAGKSDAGS